MSILKILIIFFFIFSSSSFVHAGFLDNVMNKAKEIAEDTVNTTIDQTTGSGESTSSSNQTSSESVQPGSGAKTPGLLQGADMPTRAATERAVLHYHPEVLDDEDWLRREVNLLYPDEARSFENNEFAWQKNRAALKTRIITEIKDPPLTFEVNPWTPKANGGRLVLGEYDFTRKAFPVRGFKIEVPIGYNVAVQMEELRKTIQWAPLAPDAAEKLVKSSAFTSGGRRLYARFNFTISSVNKYSKMGEIRLNPVVDIEEIQLYQYVGNPAVSNAGKDYEYVTTVEVPGTADSTAKSEQPTKPSYSVPAGVSLLQGEDLNRALIGNTIIGTNWAAYFGKDHQVETLWQQKPVKASFSIDGPLICFEKDAKVATTECIAASLDKADKVLFYELYGGKKLIPYRTAPGPFPGVADIRSGRIAAMLDPKGHLAAADADIIEIKLGMNLAEVDRIVREHRSDMKKVVYDGHKGKNSTPWEPGLVHVRYESPDMKEVIGVQFEPPTSADRVTLIWRSLSYDITTGAPTNDSIIQALYDKYGGTIPDKPKYPSTEVHNWVNNGGGLRSGTGCQARPNPLPAPLSMPGPLNFIDTKCGETLTAELRVRDGYVYELNIYLVNQAKLAEIIKENEGEHLTKTQKGVPKL